MTTINRSERPKRRKAKLDTGPLKTTIVLGSVLATLIGTDLLATAAKVDTGNIEQPANTVLSNEILSETIPSSQPPLIRLDPIPKVIQVQNLGTPNRVPNTELIESVVPVVTLEAIPEIAIPNIPDRVEINTSSGVNISLQPIPDVAEVTIPQPVTTSKSSK